jgi:hypothetical protein
MKRFKVVYLKTQTVFSSKQVPQLAEIEIKTDKNVFDIPVPLGFQVMQITEILETITILENPVEPFLNHGN